MRPRRAGAKRAILTPAISVIAILCLAPTAGAAATQVTIGPQSLAASSTALIPVEFATLSNNGSSTGYSVPGKGRVTKVRFYAANGAGSISSGISVFAGARKPGDATKFVIRAVSPQASWTGAGSGSSGIGEQTFSFPVLAGESLGIHWTEFSLGVFREDPALDPPSDTASAVGTPSAGQELPVATSSALGPLQVQYVVDLAPANTAAPTTDAGSAPPVGTTITANPGTWSSTPTGYAYQWQRCGPDGSGCSAVSGATAASYTPAPDDVGATLRVEVTAFNATGGSGDPAYSSTTGAIAATPPGPAPPPPGSTVSAPAPNVLPQPKVTLCHSGNGKNFTTITVAPEAAIDGHARNHDDDIIPPFDYVKNGRTLRFAGQNWDAEGRAILNAGCQTPASNPANQVFNPPPASKVTLCHSGNGRNFTEITVAPQAALSGHARNHSADIIPPFSFGNTSFPGKNWDATGRAIWSNGCSPPQPVTDPLEDPARKVSLCHSAGGNRYVSIEVAAAGALSGHASQHADDIIPPFTYKERGQEKTFPGQNWDTEGKATFNNGCIPPSPPPSNPEPEPVTPSVRCVTVSADGSFTAYFGYSSAAIAPLSISAGGDNSVTTEGAGASVSGPPTVFQPGAVGTAVTVSSIPPGGSATWSITSGGKTATATANAGFPRCEPEPEPVSFGLFAVCTEKSGDRYSVVFGYQNDNVVPVQAPVGEGNRVRVNGSGGPDSGQPAALAAGRNGNAFTVSGLKATDTVSWEVNVGGLQRVATASIATEPCQAEPPGPNPEPTPEPRNLEPVGPTVRCVARNSDGTYNVVFGYSNPNQVTVVAEGGAANALSVNPGDPGPETRGQPTAFQPGNVADAFTVTNVPSGQEITWTLSSYGTRSATAGIGFPTRCEGDRPEEEPKPPPIDPAPRQQAIGVYLKCVDAGKTSYSATFGYLNPGSVAITIPAGPLNGFGGSSPDRGQPTLFAAGVASEAFRITGIGINQRPTWRVVSPDGTVAEAVADAAAPNCTTGNPDRGPETDVDPKIPPTPPSGPPNKPIVTDIDNPGTEIDEKPKVIFELPGNLTPSSVFDRNITCRRSGRRVTCSSARLLPGQTARILVRVRCRRPGSGTLAISSVVRQVSLKPGPVASGSGTIRTRRCGPSYTG